MLSFETLMLPRKKIEERFLRSLPGSFDLLSLDNPDPNACHGARSVSQALEEKLVEAAVLLEERSEVLQALIQQLSVADGGIALDLLRVFSSGSSSSSALSDRLSKVSDEVLASISAPAIATIAKSFQTQAGSLMYL